MVLPSISVTKSAKDTQELGEALGHTVLKKGSSGLSKIICLWGELGSGKTTFTQGVAKGLGITSRLLSPTFIIVRRYIVSNSSLILYHMDLYRIQGNADIEGLGFSDMLTDPDALVVIEWPERLGSLLPQRRLDIHFSTERNGYHTIHADEVT